ncbi:MAG: hypothetical protein K1Y36_29845 [Blastocatellia bacterium]|nr:hypothetical protein [Blastocatellia bacterium]
MFLQFCSERPEEALPAGFEWPPATELAALGGPRFTSEPCLPKTDSAWRLWLEHCAGFGRKSFAAIFTLEGSHVQVTENLCGSAGSPEKTESTLSPLETVHKAFRHTPFAPARDAATVTMLVLKEIDHQASKSSFR